MTEDKEIEVLYKYRDWSDQYHKKLLKNLEIYFTSPKEFNDPFDSQIPVRYSENHLKRSFIETLSVKKPELSNKQKYAEYHKFKQDKKDLNKYLREFEQKQLKLNNSSGIFSLSEKWSNIVMWSHYGDDHKGFCIGFDKRLFNNFLNYQYQSIGKKTGKILLLRKVKYQDEYPLFIASSMKDEEFLDPLCTKSMMWEYEKEWRALMLTDTIRDIPNYERCFSINCKIC